MGKEITLDQLTGHEPDYQQFVNNDQRNTNDEIAKMAISELINKKKLKQMSRLKDTQIPIIVRLNAFASTFKDPYTKMLADLMLETQISINGYGRKEMVQMVQQTNPISDMMMQQSKRSKDIFR